MKGLATTGPRTVKELCAVKRLRFSVGYQSRPAAVVPAGSYRSGGRGNESVEASGETERLGRFRGVNVG